MIKKMSALFIVLLAIDLTLEGIITILGRSSLSTLTLGVIGQAIMLAFALGLGHLLFAKPYQAMGLTGPDRKKALPYILTSLGLFTLALVVIYALVAIFDQATWKAMGSMDFSLKRLLFTSTLPGICEEILYRGLILGYLFTKVRLGRKEMAGVIAFSAITFTIAHFSYSFFPLRVYWDPYQLLAAFGLGGVQAFLFYKTRNIWTSIWVHNGANFLMYVGPFFTRLFR